MNNIQLAKRIRNLCKLKNITVKSLLDSCNISKGFMYELEKNGRIPMADKLELIADYFDVSIDYLVGRTDDLQSPYTLSRLKQKVLDDPFGFVIKVLHESEDTFDDFDNDMFKSPIQESKDSVMTKEEAELLNVYRMLDVRDRTRLMSFVLDLEDNLQKVQ